MDKNKQMSRGLPVSHFDHPINLEVRLEDCANIDQMIKRFLKKFKKFKLMDEFKAHEFYLSDSERKRLERKEGKRKLRKQQREYEIKMRDK